jgi:hypothetical protein
MAGGLTADYFIVYFG